MTEEPTASKEHMKLTRRRMILGGSIAATALIVGYTATHPMQVVGAILQAGGSDPEPSAFGPFIRIGADGWVTITNKHQEMGQGIHAALAGMIAEELDADWDRVRVVNARANFRAYGLQISAGSRATRENWDLMRNAGAAARAMFVAAAATRWQVPRSSITVQDGFVSHPGSGRSAPFAELLVDASRQTPPQNPVLKAPKDYRLIGTDRLRRKDCLPKTNGTQIYTQDVRLPDMLTAMVARSPRFGGKLVRFDATDALKVKGVVDVFAIDSGVAVVAENTIAARRGRDALRTEWNDSDAEKRSSPELLQYYHEIGQGRSDVSGSTFQSKGAADTQLGPDAIECALDFPYLAHAPMETLDCVAQVDGMDVKIIWGAHLATIDQIQAALAVPTLPGKVDIEVVQAGGSFGRRGVMAADYLVECVRIAKRTNRRPVKLIWTREDEMAGGFYRPMAHHRAWVELGPDGFPASWRHRVVAQALAPAGDTVTVEGIKDSHYLSGASYIDSKVFAPRSPVTVSFWRSVGNSHTGMVMEHIVDQLARRAGRDPADYRRALYVKANATRHIRVLDELRSRAGWGRPLEAGWKQGMALHECYGTVVGQVAEVSLQDGRPVVRRVVGVVDCGMAVSPNQIAAQMEGGIVFGLSAALYGAVTLKDGVVQETNFDRYQVLRMNAMPKIETHIIPSTDTPSGMGEPAVPPIAPAVANALLALTGTPTRSLPFQSA